jgi:nitrogen fixation protein FixH
MKVLFLIVTFVSLIFTVQAQRSFTSYTCSVSHKHSETAFYLDLGESREVEVGGWKVMSAVKREANTIVVSLSRTVNVMDASYKKDATRSFPLNARTLPVVLEHSFGGVTDIFNMICYPRDP